MRDYIYIYIQLIFTLVIYIVQISKIEYICIVMNINIYIEREICIYTCLSSANS